jgi:hypothetical protein
MGPLIVESDNGPFVSPIMNIMSTRRLEPLCHSDSGACSLSHYVNFDPAAPPNPTDEF